MSTDNSANIKRASQLFRKEAQAREGVLAWQEYTRSEEATRQKTAKLKAQRLARDQAAGEAVPARKPAKKAAARRA